MTEKEALSQNLHFTGIYTRTKEVLMDRILAERIKKPKARIVIVTVPTSKFSRGSHAPGYSAYGNDLYSAYGVVQRAGDYKENHEKRLENLKTEYERELEKENERFRLQSESVEEAQAKIDVR